MFHKVLFSALLTFGLLGCSSVAPRADRMDAGTEASQAADTLPEGEGWWYARFQIDWPEGRDIDWFMGTLIAGEVIAPVFEDYHQDVQIWRIHRRAARDPAGHQLSFVFYSTPQGAQRIFNALENHPVVQDLLRRGRLSRVLVDDVSTISRPGIEDTSDRHWPLSVQKTWPAMMMGASRMWLDLVTELAAREDSAEGMEAKYRNVQDEITRLWREQGQHAVLHHLNALYAYQPLLIRY